MMWHEEESAFVCVGAAAFYLALESNMIGNQRVLIIEPDPEQAEDIKFNTSDSERFDVLNAGLADSEGTREALVFNLPRASTLAEPTGLKLLFPGLRITARPRVRTVKLATALSQAGLSQTACHLVVTTPGSEAIVLSELGSQDVRFETITLRCGERSLVEGALSMEEARAGLEAAGFSLVTLSGDDLDWPIATFKYNAASGTSRSMQPVGQAHEAELQDLQRRLEDAASRSAYEAAEIESLKQQLAVALQALEEREARLAGAEQEYVVLQQRLSEVDLGQGAEWQALHQLEAAEFRSAAEAAEIESLNAQLVAHAQMLDECKAQLAQAEGDRLRLVLMVNLEEERAQSAEDAYRREVDAEREALHSRLKAAESRHAEDAAKIAWLAAEAKEAQKRIQNALAFDAEFEARLADAEAQRQELAERLERAEARNGELEARGQADAARRTKAEASLSVVSAKLLRAEAEALRFGQIAARQKLELDETEAERQALLTRLQSARTPFGEEAQMS